MIFNISRILLGGLILVVCTSASGADNVIEKQLADIGSVPDEEVVVVQRKYTSKKFRHEITPVIFGGMPFGTVRRTLFGGASYTLHLSDLFAWEAVNFLYAKTFFSSFTDDINDNATNPAQNKIKPDYQKLLFFLTSGLTITPFYGKMSSFSRFIAYAEPYATIGGGMAKTESDTYAVGFGGIGLRTYFKEWFSLRVEFRDYIYNEKIPNRTGGEIVSQLRHNYAILLSLSFWLPKML